MTTVYLEPEQHRKLKALQERTRVPMAAYIREGIDLVLTRYAAELDGDLAGNTEGHKEPGHG
jgi:predicted DNA-binding protein